MAAILHGLLPSRKKDHTSQERILNTRCGDSSISAPIHGGWSSNASTTAQSQSSPDLDQDLPPTPPQNHDEQDGVFIVQDEDGPNESGDEVAGADRENLTITIPLLWKKKKKASSHAKKSSLNDVLNPRFVAPRRMDLMPPPLAAPEAAAIPLPESRISSPVGRTATTSPALSFRSRLASPSLGDILSPVAEGFAKEGPSSRPAPVASSLHFVQTVPLDRPATAGSMRSSGSGRPSLTSYNAEGIAAGTMSSQGTVDGPARDLSRPPSIGLGATAHMRASSRGPAANSRGPIAPSVETPARRAQSVEPINRRATPQATGSVAPGVLDLEPVRRRAPSVEPYRRRAPSLEPSNRRAPSVEPISRRVTPRAGESVVPDAHDLEPVRRRAPSVEPPRRRAPSIEPVARRAPSLEPNSRRAPSIGPSHNRRTVSREPRGRRRGASVEPATKVRFLSEAPRPTHRPDSFSSNDGSLETESDNDGSSESEAVGRGSQFTTYRPRRRRSIASPMSSPTTAAFSITQPSGTSPSPDSTKNLDSIAARAGFAKPTSPALAQRRAPRNRSQSRTRGLYSDMHDDFRLLGRDVHKTNALVNQGTYSAAAAAPSPIITQAAPSVLSSNSILQRAASPSLPLKPSLPPSDLVTAAANRVEPDRTGYASDSSLTGLPSISSRSPNQQHSQFHSHNLNNILERSTDTGGGRAMLAALAHERRDQLRREERERASEKVARKLERERERMLAMNTLSDSESVASGHVSGSEKTRRVYGGYDSDATTASTGGAKERSSGERKTLVPSAEEIWG